jgi:hypothetical protein
MCEGSRTIVTNNTYELAPWADALFAADFRWWERNPEARFFRGMKFSADRRAGTHYPWVHTLKVANGAFDTRPDHICTGANSGHCAMHTAAHLGASRIILLGFDFGASDDGKWHWHADHPEQRPMKIDLWLRAMGELAVALHARGIEVINASRRTAIPYFPRAPLHEVLCASVL